MTYFHRLPTPAFPFLVSLTISASLQAAGYNELETKPGEALNNSLESAEIISPADFTTPEPPEVFTRPGSLTATVNGSSAIATAFPEDVIDVDIFRFSTLGSSSNLALFDIDGTDENIDSVLALFDESGQLIAFSDDMDVIDPGSGNILLGGDSLIGEIALKSGSYFIAVTQWPNESEGWECFEPLTRPDGEYGGDTCISGSASFPNPAYTIDNPIFEGRYKLHISLQASETPPPPQPKFMPWLPLLLE